ncbi:MAG: hypothetical protein ACLP0L_25920 [Solirubrobacteraceae bacterium]
MPEGGLHRASAAGVWLPTAALVVEVVSLRDETYAKLAFYVRHRVDEVLVIDPLGSRHALSSRCSASDG